MNKLILVTILLIAVVAIFAQNPIAKGQSQLNAGLGFSSWGVPIYLGFDYGVHRDITMGLEGSYRDYRHKDNNHYYDHTIFGLSGNGNYHFNRIMNIPRNWDFYAGLNVGAYFWDNRDEYNDNQTSGLHLGAQLGGRFYFNDAVGVNLEFGGGNAFSGGKIGLSVKL